ncbi:hypothetical protein FOQG_04201 [Fusarium oxysporum f. sp. raphani 54005]|uniref:Uncharacterized protein n=1 Tax=Fusarium oxysporum f. sp. raphani 54005 TaxID=1089458 RepID=X0CNB3_FUSOX|nr:hypothetical protein FOQG_04201 [Fusarium oxysporum f. sp. raphani 54005]
MAVAHSGSPGARTRLQAPNTKGLHNNRVLSILRSKFMDRHTFYSKESTIIALVETLSTRTLFISDAATKCTSEIPDAPVDIKNILSHKCLCYGTLQRVLLLYVVEQ